MPADVHQVVTLSVFFAALALALWRRPQADRAHVVLCAIAAALWCGLLLFEPRTRTAMYGFSVSAFLSTALAPLRERLNTRH